MTSHREAEATSAPDERAPLLAHQGARPETHSAPESEDEAVLVPEKTASKTWHYVWRGFWVIFVVFIIAVFVKGWIEADDVNVSLKAPLYQHGTWDLISRDYSSILKAH
jgi:hypothetical protein